ncbi:hypothetical protein B0T14DRAFT_209691 [Immersiella caudata]|uniref:Uncharacterized protein n=1 Tax=Immersiella caudata TaxID=314043 RepID=A0AA39WQ83_9PEZI|nr:hypothetical protein B0T14DRAFT_209691 [Immersiella caudata]
MLSSPQICRQPSPLRNSAVFWFLLVAVSLAPKVAQAEGHAATSPTSTDEIFPGLVAFGFHLGQPYGTSVARLENRTTIPLSQILGTGDYVVLMEGVVAQPTTLPYWFSLVGLLSNGGWVSPQEKRAMFRFLPRW